MDENVFKEILHYIVGMGKGRAGILRKSEIASKNLNLLDQISRL